MKNKIEKKFCFLVGMLLIITSTIVIADWIPGDEHKMHYPQLPDPNGWDVFANFEVPFLPLADDWMCSETGPVTDIHFWGSWLYDIEGIIDGFDISIWDDIPADQSPTGYSMPGTMLWNEYFNLYEIVPMSPSPQGWYDPFGDWYEPQGNHFNYYQYNIENITNPFIQQYGTIYWLCIRPNVVPSMYPDPPLWGWKTSLDHWNDDAVYWDEMNPFGWTELYDPITGLSLDLAFVITGEEEGPNVDVEKRVRDETTGEWVDYIDAEICTISRFNLSIHNNGTDSYIVTKIWDVLPPCVEYYNNAIVNGIPFEPDVISLPTIEWNYPIPPDYWYPGSLPGELPPGEWIFVEFDVHVIGPPCIDNVNWGYWDVYYNDEYYYFDDNATIHPIDSLWSNHKMHYPQLPDPNGWDVLANFDVPFLPLADDWMCSETGPVTDIHFWGSWLYDIEGIIDGFDISIWDDIPADQSPTGYSIPGTMLWNEYFNLYEIVPMSPSPQGWYDPYFGWYEPQGNHFNYYQYNIENITNPFIQQNGTIYWLCIRPNVVPSMYPDPPLWGWKTSLDHWNDDAVYWDEMNPFGWTELYDPITGLSLDFSFVITGIDMCNCTPSIDVEKYVWDPLNHDWIDDAVVDIEVGQNATFLITIHNNGNCSCTQPCYCINLTSIQVYDLMEDSFLFLGADYDPLSSDPVPGGTQIIWDFPGPLAYCNWINITVWAEVLGPVCQTDENYVNVTAYCEFHGVEVSDFDSAFVHAIEPFEAEFGDAPEDAIAYPSTSTIGVFPTCMCCGPVGWVQHDSLFGGGLFFGNMKDNEIDGNAGWCPMGGFPPYDQDEGFFGGSDGGLMWPDPYTIDSTMNVVPLVGTGTPLGYIGQTANWGVEVDMFVQNWLPIDAYVNVLADWNQNGQWGEAGEHILVDFTIPSMWNGPISILGPPSFTIGPNQGYVWTRFSITELPVSIMYPIPWDGEGYFEEGETEDYLLQILKGIPIASFNYEPVNPTTVDTVYFNSTSYDPNPGGFITNWTWNIGGTLKYGEYVIYQFTSVGTYTVTLTVTDNSGNIASTCKLVPVGDIYEVTNNISRGWNIISPPFNQSVQKTDLIIKYNGYYYSFAQATSSSNPTGSPIINQFVFGWQRTAPQMYLFATVLDPGYGYWFYSFHDNIEFWTTNIATTPDNYITHMKTGWNLVGVPDSNSVSKTNLIVNYGGTDYTWANAVTNGYVSDFVFGWQRTTPQMYIFATVLYPEYGYWIYAYNDCVLKK